MFQLYQSYDVDCLGAVAFAVVLTLRYVMLQAFYQAYATPLWDVPGPWPAKFTHLWQLQAVYARSFHNVKVALHKRHGLLLHARSCLSDALLNKSRTDSTNRPPGVQY